MRRHPRDIATATAKTEIDLKLDHAGWENYEDIFDALITLKREILDDMIFVGPTVSDALLTNARAIVTSCMAEYDLTTAEIYQILTGYELHCTKYMLRYERHGDFEKEGGLEQD